MRLLLLSDEGDLQRLVQHHAACRWPQVEVRLWSPLLRGTLPAEFLAQGFDAVLLVIKARNADSMETLRDLASRPGFAPLICLSDDLSASALQAAKAWGAHGVVRHTPLAHPSLLEAIDAAAAQQRRAMADWRVSNAAAESHRFGDARIPGYRRARLLARGSVSQLYVAESEKAGELVALKVTPSERDDSGVDQVFERFLQEYEIAERVRHPNIVRLHELGVADDHAYLAMEYFPLGDFRRRLKSGLTPSEALAFGAQIARILAAVHAAGVLHRDLKPGNLMMRASEEIALIDFGLAKQLVLGLELTGAGLIFGTPYYMSPEQGHGQRLDQRSDLYSLGIVLHEMLTGNKPYTAENPMTVLYMHRNAPLPVLPPQLETLQPLLNRLIAKLPEDRHAHAIEAAEALDEARGSWLQQGMDVATA